MNLNGHQYLLTSQAFSVDKCTKYSTAEPNSTFRSALYFIIWIDPDDGVKTSLRNASLLLRLRHKILHQNILFASSSLLRALNPGNEDATVPRNVGKRHIQNDINTNQQHPEDLTSNAKGLSGCEVV